MKKQQSLQFISLLFIVILNIGCDQVSKTIVRQKIDYNENISLITKHVTLTKVENTGAFLSAGNELPEVARLFLLTLLPMLVLAYGLYYLFTHKQLPVAMQIGLCFIIGGGIGNIFDRVRFGSVTDFLHIDFVIFRTGIFNFADLSIMIGIGILLIHSFSNKIIKPIGTEETS